MAHPIKFQTPELYIKAMGLLENYRYRTQMRRFVMVDLFDKCVVETLVRDGRPPELESPSISSPAESRDNMEG